MPQYLLLLHEDPAAARALSPEEMQRVIEAYTAWSQQLAAEGRLAQGVKLRDEGGRQVRPAGAGGAAGAGARAARAPTVIDGPYAEGKEVVAGFFVVEAPDYAGAVAIAAGCPHLAHGWLEVRAIEPL
jgi:hypothetical protein